MWGFPGGPVVKNPPSRMGGKGTVREFRMDWYTLLYVKPITSKDLLYSSWNSIQCCVAAWMGGEFGGEWVHVYVWLAYTLHRSPETITTLLTGYTPVQNKIFKKNNNSIQIINTKKTRRIHLPVSEALVRSLVPWWGN